MLATPLESGVQPASLAVQLHCTVDTKHGMVGAMPQHMEAGT